MDVNVNTNSSGTLNFDSVQTNATTQTTNSVKTPVVNQPPVDNMSRSDLIQQVTAYAAPTQNPQLPKPGEKSTLVEQPLAETEKPGDGKPVEQPVVQPPVQPNAEKPDADKEGKANAGKPGDGKTGDGKSTSEENATKHTGSAQTNAGLQDQPTDQSQVQQQQQDQGGQDQGQSSGGQGGDSGGGQGSGSDSGSSGSNQGGSQSNSQSDSHGGSRGGSSGVQDGSQGDFSSIPQAIPNLAVGTPQPLIADNLFVKLDGSPVTVGAAPSVGIAAPANLNAPPVSAPVPNDLHTTGTGQITPLNATPVTPFELSQNLVSISQQIQQLASAIVASMPDGPDKMRFADFLTKVGNALRAVQAILQEMQIGDSANADKQSKAQLDMRLNQINAQKEEMGKQWQKQMDAIAKQATMSLLSKIFAFLIPLLIIIMAPIMIPLMLMLIISSAIWMPIVVSVVVTSTALLAAEFIDCCATVAGKPTFAMEGLMNAMDTVIGGIFAANATPEERKKIEEIIKFIVLLVCLIFLVVAAMPAMIFGGIMVITDMMQKTHMFGNVVKAAGGTDAQAEQADSYAALAVSVIFAIVSIIACLVMPFMEAAEALEIVEMAVEGTEVALALTEDIGATVVEETVETAQIVADELVEGLVEGLGQVELASGELLTGEEVLADAETFLDTVETLATTGLNVTENATKGGAQGGASAGTGTTSGTGTAGGAGTTSGTKAGGTAGLSAEGSPGVLSGAGTEGSTTLMQAAGKVLKGGALWLFDKMKSILKQMLDPEFLLQVLLDASTLGVDVVSSVTEYKMNMLKADLARIQGRIDAEYQLTEAHIKILKKVIQDLLESMGNFSKEAAQVAGLNKKIISGQSNVVANLFSSSGA